mgnify:CR=1 FL=1
MKFAQTNHTVRDGLRRLEEMEDKQITTSLNKIDN